jgi:hypothetical protein
MIPISLKRVLTSSPRESELIAATLEGSIMFINETKKKVHRKGASSTFVLAPFMGLAGGHHHVTTPAGQQMKHGFFSSDQQCIGGKLPPGKGMTESASLTSCSLIRVVFTLEEILGLGNHPPSLP